MERRRASTAAWAATTRATNTSAEVRAVAMGKKTQAIPLFSLSRASGHHSQRPVTPVDGTGSDQRRCDPASRPHPPAALEQPAAAVAAGARPCFGTAVRLASRSFGSPGTCRMPRATALGPAGRCPFSLATAAVGARPGQLDPPCGHGGAPQLQPPCRAIWSSICSRKGNPVSRVH